MAESSSLLRQGAAWALGMVVPAAGTAAMVVGVQAALAVVVGAVVTGACIAVLARGLAAMLVAATPAAPGDRGARRTRVGSKAFALFLVRHAALAAVLWVAISAGLSPGWMVVGVTAWPVALAIAGLRLGGAGAPAADSA